MNTKLTVNNVSKTFVLHNQNGVELPVLTGANFSVDSGECVVLHGHQDPVNQLCCVRYMPTT